MGLDLILVLEALPSSLHVTGKHDYTIILYRCIRNELGRNFFGQTEASGWDRLD